MRSCAARGRVRATFEECLEHIPKVPRELVQESAAVFGEVAVVHLGIDQADVVTQEMHIGGHDVDVWIHTSSSSVPAMASGVSLGGLGPTAHALSARSLEPTPTDGNKRREEQRG